LAFLIAGAVIALAVMTRSARRAWKDHHSLREHHRTLDTLGEVAHHQDSAIAPIPDQSMVRAHVRVVNPDQPGPPRPARPAPTPPLVAASLVARTVGAPLLSRPRRRRWKPPRARWLVKPRRRRVRSRWLVVAGIAMAGAIVAVAVVLVVTGAVRHAASGPVYEGLFSAAWG
jgi:hypothetical protein